MAGIASKIWTDDLVALVHRCERGDPEAALLREIHTLLANGPKELCEPIAQAIPRGELDRLIECGASESAALRLLGACGYMVSAGAGSQAIVKGQQNGIRLHTLVKGDVDSKKEDSPFNIRGVSAEY